MEEEDLDNFDFPSNTEEFDSSFHTMNPGVRKAQRYLHQNFEELKADQWLGLGEFGEDGNAPVYNVNLTINKRVQEKALGLNANKRGKIK